MVAKTEQNSTSKFAPTEKGWQEIRSYHPLHEIFMKLNLITLVTLGFFYTL